MPNQCMVILLTYLISSLYSLSSSWMKGFKFTTEFYSLAVHFLFYFFINWLTNYSILQAVSCHQFMTQEGVFTL